MATYRILYWQNIPSQIKVEDDDDEVMLPLPQKFMERIDEVAAATGLQGADDYLSQWRWSAEEERDGTAQQVAQELKAELEAQANW